MHYSNEVLDRKTGEIISVSAGDWMTLRELADVFGCGRRTLTVILRELAFLQIEYDGRYNRYRVADWVVSKGWGKRLRSKSSKYPFDIVSSDAVLWLIDRWEQALRNYGAKLDVQVVHAKKALKDFQKHRDETMTVEMQVCWIRDIFPDLTQKEIAEVVDVSQPIVSRYLRKRSNRLTELSNNKRAHSAHFWWTGIAF